MGRKPLDLTGEKFGILTVIKEVDRDKHNQRRWSCKCECGTIKVISMKSLRSGTTKSCGCLPPKRMDLTGEKFGRLTVLKEDETKNKTRRFICQCECGNTTSVYMNSLRAGITRSCGCLRDERASETHKKDLTNQRFGKLVALKTVGIAKNKNLYVWLCKCDCGNETTARSDNLISGGTKSCGCLKKEQNDKNLYMKKEELRVDGVMVPSLMTKTYSNNTSGHKGVYWSKRDKRWIARIALKGKETHIGAYINLDDAVSAREKAEKIIHLPYVEALEEILKIRNKT